MPGRPSLERGLSPDRDGTASTPGPISSSAGLRGSEAGPPPRAASPRDPPPRGEGAQLGLSDHHIARRRVVQHRQLGLPQALDLVAQARGLLEVEIGGGLAHARLHVGDHRFQIVADGGGVAEFAFARRRRWK